MKLICLSNSFLSPQKATSVSGRVMLFTETMTIYPEHHINTINTVRAEVEGFSIRAGGKYSNSEVNHSAPSNTKVKNEWRYASTPPYMP